MGYILFARWQLEACCRLITSVARLFCRLEEDFHAAKVRRLVVELSISLS